MKKLVEHLSQEWYKYLLEMIVITAGIVGAFALNNWNEDRKSGIKEEKMLTMIMDRLDSDIRFAFSNFEHRNRSSNEGIRWMLDGCSEDSIRIDELISVLTFQIDTGPYDQLQTIGMDLISNDSLSSLILTTFNNLEWYHNQIHGELNDRIKNYILPFVFEHFAARKQPDGTYDLLPKDYDALKKNPEWTTVLAHRLEVNISDSLMLQWAKGNMLDLRDQLEKELEK